jgi:uncharacterized protein
MANPTVPTTRAYQVVAKPTGAVCNLDCAYCVFLSKEELYPGSTFRMQDDVLEAYVRQVIEAQRVPHVTISWQGGEPTLMGQPFFEKAVSLVKKHLRSGMTVEHTLQTNGTLLDEAWCEFFRKNDFLVGLSLDGPREMHDAYRVDKGGAPTFDCVRDAARLMQRHGVTFSVVCAVHAANGDRPLEVYRFLRDEVGTSLIQFLPIVERTTPDQEGRLVTERSVKPEQWGDFLIAVFDEWIRRDVGAVFVQMFDAALSSWLGIENPMCIFNEKCGASLAVEHNGDLYSCEHFVEPKHLLGNIARHHIRDLVATDQQRAFGDAKLSTLPAYCRACDVRFACHGECPRNRFTTTPDGEPGLNYLCAGYKAFFRHVDRPMRIMADLVRKGRYADEVMQILDE